MKRFVSLILILMLIVPALSLQAQTAQPIIGFWDKCPAPTALPDTVTIGAIFGLSGGTAVYGVPQKQAVQLAVDEVNNSGYLGAKTKLAVNFEDDAGDKTQGINAMTKLVTSDKVIAVIGPTLSATAFAADPVAQENKTVVVGVSNTAVGITQMGDFIFRDSLPETAVIPGTVAEAIKILGLKKVGVLYGNDDDFTKSSYDVFKKVLTDNNITIQDTETFARGDVDFNAQLTKLIGNTPDALIVSALAQEAVPIMTQARQLGFNGPIIGGNGFNSPAILQTGPIAEGVIIGGAWNLGNPNPSKSSVAFVTAYNAAYKADPDQFAAQAYTGAWLVATAIRCANSADHTAVRDALAAIKDFESPLGSFSFDENRDPVHPPVAQIVKSGKYVVLTEGAAAATPEPTAEPTASK